MAPGMEPEAAPRPPAAVAEPAPSQSTQVRPEELKKQISNLLAQIDSLQKNTDNRRPAKLERYARELGATKAELKDANLKIANLEGEVRYQRGTLNLMGSQIKTAQDLKDKALDDVISLREKMAIDKKKLERFQIHLQVSIFLLLVLTVFAFFFGRQWGKVKAARAANVQVSELKDKVRGAALYAKELKMNHARELRVKEILLGNLHANLTEKNDRISGLVDAIKTRDSYIIELREALKRKRARVQELKRQRAGPLPETQRDAGAEHGLPSDETPLQEAGGEFFGRVQRLPQAPSESFGPLDPGDEQEE